MTLFSKTGHESAYIDWWLERQKKRVDQLLVMDNIAFHVHKDVFSPDIAETYSTALILETMPKDLTGRTALDVGSGSGILGISAARRGAARLVITDNNDAALLNIQRNILHHDLSDRVDLRPGDLFSNVTGQFDLITANLPIVDEAWLMIEAGTYNLQARFLKALPDFLTLDGSCYFSFASFGDTDRLGELVNGLELNYEITAKTAFSISWYVIRFFHG